jgi:hypothetical protein
LRYSPQRAFLANGEDPVTVHAFLMARRETPLPGFRVRLFDGAWTTEPVPVVIPPGAEEGMATFTSDHEGQFMVEYLSATPAVDLDRDSESDGRIRHLCPWMPARDWDVRSDPQAPGPGYRSQFIAVLRLRGNLQEYSLPGNPGSGG